jgi:hypothetical protein
MRRVVDTGDSSFQQDKGKATRAVIAVKESGGLTCAMHTRHTGIIHHEKLKSGDGGAPGTAAKDLALQETRTASSGTNVDHRSAQCTCDHRLWMTRGAHVRALAGRAAAQGGHLIL